MLQLGDEAYDRKYIELAGEIYDLGRLPMTIEKIIALEGEGHVVDLLTGEILWHGSEQRVLLTIIGAAVATAPLLRK